MNAIVQLSTWCTPVSNDSNLYPILVSIVMIHNFLILLFIYYTHLPFIFSKVNQFRIVYTPNFQNCVNACPCSLQPNEPNNK